MNLLPMLRRLSLHTVATPRQSGAAASGIHALLMAAAGVLICSSPVRADDKTLAKPSPAKRAADFALIHRSSFQVSGDQARNPFLPIGYVRAIAAAPKVELDVRAEQFVVSSFSLEPPPLAVVNGRTYGIGDSIPVNAAGTDFVIVRRIIDGGVVVDYHGHLLTCQQRLRGAK